jgi:hypothetical protein
MSKPAPGPAIGDPLDAAFLHFVQALIEDQDVPIGTYDVSGMKATITAPDGALVVRDEGKDGDGFQEYAMGGKGVSAAALATFLARCRDAGSVIAGPRAVSVWVESIKESVGADAKELLPPEALEAVELVRAEGVMGRRRTPANRVGVDRAKLTITRPKKAKRKPPASKAS